MEVTFLAMPHLRERNSCLLNLYSNEHTVARHTAGLFNLCLF